jgi:hypothetical protein
MHGPPTTNATPNTDIGTGHYEGTNLEVAFWPGMTLAMMQYLWLLAWTLLYAHIGAARTFGSHGKYTDATTCFWRVDY